MQELRALNDYLGCEYGIYYWHTRANLEIDFVLYGPYGLLAIEVKRSPQVQLKQTRALREFKKDYPPARCYLFYGGTVPQYLEDITVLPIDYALKNLGRILTGDK